MADPATAHARLNLTNAKQPDGATAVLVLADGHIAWGRGFGAVGDAVGEVCFNTAMTGYQEVMTDPSYAGQIVTFTFPHIGNVGVNDEDIESHVDGAVGCVVRQDVTLPSNFRASGGFGEWLAAKGKIGIAGLDTRALTRRVRMGGAPNAAIAHAADGKFDIPALIQRAHQPAWLPARQMQREKGQQHGGDAGADGNDHQAPKESKHRSHRLQGRLALPLVDRHGAVARQRCG